MKILAVDDDPIILELLTEIFLMFGGNDLLTASSGEEALQIAAREPDIDCFLLDIQMPNMDGITLCRALRDMDDYQRTPILMTTAMSEKRYIDGAFAAGASDYINKPFEISELRARIALVDSLVGQSRAAVDGYGVVRPRKTEDAKSRLESLQCPFPIRDVDGVIEEYALENYVSKLTRKDLFGSSVFAFAIRRVEQLYGEMSPFDFQCLITDVAEALADCMQGHQFLMAYLGNGIYGCVTEEGWVPNTEKFVDDVQLLLHQMDLHCSDGRPLRVRLAAGRAKRLMWRSGNSAVSALVEACNSAEEEAEKLERSLDEFWYMERSA